MTYSVDSYFYYTLQQKSLVLDQPTPVNCYSVLSRKFTINNSDYSSRVKRWPTFRTSYDQVKSNQFTIELANHDQAMNFFRENKRYMASSCNISLNHDSYNYSTYAIKCAGSLHQWFANSYGDSTALPTDDLTLEYICRFNKVQSASNTHNYIYPLMSDASPFGSPYGWGIEIKVTSGTAYVEFGVRSMGAGTYNSIQKTFNNDYYDGYTQHLIATRKNGSHMALWLNDALVASQALTTSFDLVSNADSTYLTLLYNQFNALPTSDYNIDFDMIRGYSRYMDDNDIPKMFSGIYENDSDLFAWYDFRLQSGNYTADASGNQGNTLIVNSGSTRQEGIVYYDPILYSSSYYDGFRHSFTEINSVVVGLFSNDEISLLKGTITAYEYEGSKIRLTIQDKFKAFEERIVGTSDAPADYTGSNHLPSDIAWYLCTSYGGLDSTKSTANTDIDYASFSTWAAIFSDDSVFCEGIFKGVKVTEGLRKIGKMTKSAIYQEENKLFFQRFVNVDTQSIYIDKSKYINLKTETNIKDVTNKQYVFAGYDTTSRYHSITVVSSNASSINSFGTFENKIQDSSLWYVGSASATNLAERITVSEGQPYEKITAKVALFGVISQIGDTLYIDDPSLGIDNEVFRVLHRDYDMHNSSVILKGDQVALGSLFKLDFSALDSSDTLG